MKTMQNSHRYLFVSLALVAVVLIAGCTGGKNRALFNVGQDSLKVSIDTEGRDTFDSLQPFAVTVSAENTGVFDVTNVAAKLQGYDGITAQTPSIKLSDEKKLSPATLDRPDSEKKIPGGVGSSDWDVYAPFVGVGEPDRQIALTAQVLYDTKSLATQRVVAATREYITQLQAAGKQLPATPQTESQNGPVSIGVEVPTPYVKLLGDQRTDLRAKITFNNDGTGTLMNRNSGTADYMTQVILRLPPGVGVDATNCDLVPLGSTSDVSVERQLVVDATHNPEKLRLLQGGLTRDLNCHLYVDKDYVGADGFNTFDLKIESYYTYVQEITHDLVIKGTEEKPLRINILSPTGANPEDWVRNTIHSVKFTLLYQNIPITTGILPADIKATLGSKTAQGVDLKFDPTDKDWVLRVRTPDLGTPQAAYDLSVDAKYGADTTNALQRNAVNYSPVLVPAGTQ